MPPEALTRRSVLRGTAVSGCAAVTGFALASTNRPDPAGGPTAANGYGRVPGPGRLLARLDEVGAGSGLVLSSDQIVLSRGPDGAVHGFSAVCTHQGCPVGSVVGGVIVCPCHDSRFDALTGNVVSGPATRGLPAIPVVVRSDGIYTG